MSKNWIHALKEYFLLWNRLQAEGDSSEIFVCFHDEESAEKEAIRIMRGRESIAERKGKLLHCKTKVRDIQILSQSDEAVDLVVQSNVWQLYQISNQQIEQEEEQLRAVTLKEQDGVWKVAQDTPLYLEGGGDRQLKQQQTDEEQEENFYLLEKGGYNRIKVREYAEQWWNSYNPVYPKFEVDCTNFVSQCIHAGGIPQVYSGQRTKGWWVQGKHNWSYSWSVANSLMNYLINGKNPLGETKSSADQLMVGDVICYDWDGGGGFEHNTIVVAKDPAGMPLVNAHTVNSRQRYWEYRDSHAWSPNTVYKFIHIKK